jgi:hypothetical protein
MESQRYNFVEVCDRDFLHPAIGVVQRPEMAADFELRHTRHKAKSSETDRHTEPDFQLNDRYSRRSKSLIRGLESGGCSGSHLAINVSGVRDIPQSLK